MKKEDQLFEDLQNGTSLFTFIPDNIGEIIYCDTTNNHKDPYTTFQKIKKTIIYSFITAALIALLYLLLWHLWDKPIAFWILSAVLLFILYLELEKTYTFTGDDYFVGKEGFAMVHFKKSRENIEKKVYHFSDIDDVLSSEKIATTSKGAYSHTNYDFRFYGYRGKDDTRKLILGISSIYRQEELGNYYKDDDFRFLKTVEMIWNESRLNQMQSTFSKGKPVSFNYYTKEKIENDYFVFDSTDFIIDGTRYDNDTIGKLKFKNNKMIIESSDYTSKHFSHKQTGNKLVIDIDQIGSHDIFFVFLRNHIINYMPKFHNLL